MNFMKYPTKNDISISNAVLKLAKLQNAERLELTAATGAVIVTSGRMTVKELLSTVQSLTGRAAELMTLLRLTCGDCTNCSEKCAYRDRSITELIRPAVVVPDWARQDAGLAGDAKLDCYVDEDTHELTVVEADYAHDLSDVPPELLFALHQSGCCLSALEDAAVDDLRTRTVSDIVCIVIALAGLITISPASLLGALLAMLPFYLCAGFGLMGGGDWRLAAAVGFVLGVGRVLTGFLFMSVALLLASLVMRTFPTLRQSAAKKQPLVPYFAVAFIPAYFL